MRSSVRGKGCWGFSGDGDQRVEVGLGAARIWRGERRGAVLEAERERGGGGRMDQCEVFGGGYGLDDGFSLLIWLMRNMGEEGWFSLGFRERVAMYGVGGCVGMGGWLERCGGFGRFLVANSIVPKGWRSIGNIHLPHICNLSSHVHNKQ